MPPPSSFFPDPMYSTLYRLHPSTRLNLIDMAFVPTWQTVKEAEDGSQGLLEWDKEKAKNGCEATAAKAGENIEAAKEAMVLPSSWILRAWSVVEFGEMMPPEELRNTLVALRWSTDYLLKTVTQSDRIIVRCLADELINVAKDFSNRSNDAAAKKIVKIGGRADHLTKPDTSAASSTASKSGKTAIVNHLFALNQQKVPCAEVLLQAIRQCFGVVRREITFSRRKLSALCAHVSEDYPSFVTND
ncbi:hypothetical protein Tco_1362114 [Tanacetum coccineum]